MFTTVIETWKVDNKGNEYYGKETRYFDTKEERDFFRFKYNLGIIHTSDLRTIKEAYNEYKSTEDFG